MAICHEGYAQQSKPLSIAETGRLIKLKPDSAFLFIKQTLNIALQQKDKETTGLCYQQIGEVFYYHSDYLTALDYYLKADNILRTGQDKVLIAQNLVKIGTTYYYDRKKDQAEKAFNEALSLFQAAGYQQGVALSYSWIGLIYNKRLVYDKAIYYEQLALQLYTTLKDTLGIAKVYENIGSNYEDKADYPKALQYFQRSFALNQAKNNTVDEADVVNNIGDIYRKTARYPEALAATHRAADLAIALNDRFQLRSAYFDLSKAFHLMGREDSAYYYVLKDRELNFQIYDEAKEKQMSLLQVLYSVNQKDNEIAKLEKDKQINRLVISLVVLSTFFFAVLAVIIFRRQKTRIRHQQELNDKNDKLRALEKSMIEVERQQHQLKESSLQAELETRNKELTAHTLHLIRKNQLLEEVKTKLEAIQKDDKRDQKQAIRQLIVLFNQGDLQDRNWEDFRAAFEQVHQHFFERLQTYSTTLTANDLRLLALLKINLSPADIASFLGISQDSLRVSRHRLRRKLGLNEGDSLTSFIQQL